VAGCAARTPVPACGVTYLGWCCADGQGARVRAGGWPAPVPRPCLGSRQGRGISRGLAFREDGTAPVEPRASARRFAPFGYARARQGAVVPCVARPAPGPRVRPRRDVCTRSMTVDSVGPTLRLGLDRCPACAGSRQPSPAWRLPGPHGVPPGYAQTRQGAVCCALPGQRRVLACVPGGMQA